MIAQNDITTGFHDLGDAGSREEAAVVRQARRITAALKRTTLVIARYGYIGDCLHHLVLSVLTGEVRPRATHALAGRPVVADAAEAAEAAESFSDQRVRRTDAARHHVYLTPEAG